MNYYTYYDGFDDLATPDFEHSRNPSYDLDSKNSRMINSNNSILSNENLLSSNNVNRNNNLIEALAREPTSNNMQPLNLSNRLTTIGNKPKFNLLSSFNDQLKSISHFDHEENNSKNTSNNNSEQEKKSPEDPGLLRIKSLKNSIGNLQASSSDDNLNVNLKHGLGDNPTPSEYEEIRRDQTEIDAYLTNSSNNLLGGPLILNSNNTSNNKKSSSDDKNSGNDDKNKLNLGPKQLNFGNSNHQLALKRKSESNLDMDNLLDSKMPKMIDDSLESSSAIKTDPFTNIKTNTLLW